MIKLWLTRTPARLYTFHSPDWETASYANDLVSIADHQYFRNVFAMPFTTIILVVDSRHDVWSGDGMKPEEIEAGMHVHVHNVEGIRGRGDKTAQEEQR